jgi:tetratricopeptide (TPR) repeat protein
MRTADFYARWGALEQRERLGIQAEQHLLNAINLEPGHEAAHETLGAVYFDRGSYLQAGQAYENAAGLAPLRAAELYARAGEAYEEGGNTARAAEMFERALEKRRGYAPAEQGLGRLREPRVPTQRVKMFPPLGGHPDRGGTP